MMVLNEKLVQRQGITETGAQEILNLHAELQDIVKNPENYNNPVELIREIEFRLQELWKLPLDENFHSHWLSIKGCECPTIDNYERMGTQNKVISGACPWHGNKEKNV